MERFFEKFVMLAILIILIIMVIIIVRPTLIDQNNFQLIGRELTNQNSAIRSMQQDIVILKDKMLSDTKPEEKKAPK